MGGNAASVYLRAPGRSRSRYLPKEKFGGLRWKRSSL